MGSHKYGAQPQVTWLSQVYLNYWTKINKNNNNNVEFLFLLFSFEVFFLHRVIFIFIFILFWPSQNVYGTLQQGWREPKYVIFFEFFLSTEISWAQCCYYTVRKHQCVQNSNSSKYPGEDSRAHSIQHIGVQSSFLFCVYKGISIDHLYPFRLFSLMHWISTSYQGVKLMLPSKKKFYVHITSITPPREFPYKPDLYWTYSACR